ncbi:MAG: hypothetical protein K6E51_08460 [Treponema sp.]|nr:hypothetical protein [Treponema sp.]
MYGFELQQTQKASQIQSQKMTQMQIYSLHMLSLGNQDLRSEIFSAVEKNPALEIVRDPYTNEGDENTRTSSYMTDHTRTASVSASGMMKSDALQDILENRPDERETLQEHLLHQLYMMSLSHDEVDLCKRLIDNLDNKGFHILAPVSLVPQKLADKNSGILEKCLSVIQHMDPVGVGCVSVQESLYIQALAAEDAPDAALFILNGHFDFLDPPVPQKILKKISDYQKSQRGLFGVDEVMLDKIAAFTVADIENALHFIRMLDPYPARQYGSSTNSYIVPDVYVDKLPLLSGFDDVDKQLVVNSTGNYSFRVRLSDAVLPQIVLSAAYAGLEKKSISTDDKKFVTGSVAAAKVFLDSLAFRQSTIEKACCAIVKKQLAFFEKGPGHLVPLRQKDIADAIGVHEATISRMANGKFLQCEWGLFAIKYFFSNAVATSSSTSVSKDSVQREIAAILESQPVGAKPLSDQKISNLLAAKGITVARRTVAKYRNQLHINSSFERK